MALSMAIYSFSQTESGETLQSVTNRGASTTNPLILNRVGVGNVTPTTGYTLDVAGDVLFRNSFYVQTATFLTGEFRCQVIGRRDVNSVLYFVKPAGTLPSQLKMYSQTSFANTISLNSTWMTDTVIFTSNTNSAGFNVVHLNPVISQTGYSGITRGFYVNPVLTGVTSFRAVETNVTGGKGFQIYAGGTAPSVFNGYVGIGTNDPKSELAVNGTIISKKVKVTMTGWPDYVFDSSYMLSPLSQLERFIKINRHLPDVPPATEVAKEGIDLGNNQAVLLKKIEELTLYIIGQNKKIEKMEKKMEEMESILKER